MVKPRCSLWNVHSIGLQPLVHTVAACRPPTQVPAASRQMLHGAALDVVRVDTTRHYGLLTAGSGH